MKINISMEFLHIRNSSAFLLTNFGCDREDVLDALKRWLTNQDKRSKEFFNLIGVCSVNQTLQSIQSVSPTAALVIRHMWRSAVCLTSQQRGQEGAKDKDRCAADEKIVFIPLMFVIERYACTLKRCIT